MRHKVLKQLKEFQRQYDDEVNRLNREFEYLRDYQRKLHFCYEEAKKREEDYDISKKAVEGDGKDKDDSDQSDSDAETKSSKDQSTNFLAGLFMHFHRAATSPRIYHWAGDRYYQGAGYSIKSYIFQLNFNQLVNFLFTLFAYLGIESIYAHVYNVMTVFSRMSTLYTHLFPIFSHSNIGILELWTVHEDTIVYQYNILNASVILFLSLARAAVTVQGHTMTSRLHLAGPGDQTVAMYLAVKAFMMVMVMVVVVAVVTGIMDISTEVEVETMMVVAMNLKLYIVLSARVRVVKVAITNLD